MTSSTPASHDAFHAHLDACERCRHRPFDLCDVGNALLRAVGDGGAVAPVSETPRQKLERMLTEAVAGLGPLASALKLEAIALGVAEKAAAAGNRKIELFWLTRAQEARNEANRLVREAAAKDGVN